MAQYGSLAAREHRCHPIAVLAQAPVPDRVDAAVNAVQAPASHPHLDRAASQPRFAQLRARDRSVLRSGDSRKALVEFCIYEMHKPPKASVSPRGMLG